MNCVDLAIRQTRDKPAELALWMPGPNGGSRTTFGELLDQATRVQRSLIEHRVAPGDTVLLVDGLGPRLYATILALLSLGASAMLVEPWLSVGRIEAAVREAHPVAFIASWPGRFWGARVPAIRAVKHWLSAAQLTRNGGAANFHIESVAPGTDGILTFTSGTTGMPRGVARTHEFLLRQHQALCDALGSNRFRGHDLAIFANFVLSNLAAGRGTVLIPPPWRPEHLKQIDDLPLHLQPETLTCGPGFLLRLMKSARLKTLRSINVGGALTDCATFETGFEHWPDADWLNVYGSTEAEPVATCDGRLSVSRSRSRGYFQALCIGAPVPTIDSELGDDGLRVRGAHVGPRYLGPGKDSRIRDDNGANDQPWHCMGDRVISEPGESGYWWYAGRSSQTRGDFDLEQRIYSLLQSSNAFIHRSSTGEPVLIGEHLGSTSLPGIASCIEAKICRVLRHRARIDRQKTLEQGAPWLLG